MNDSQQNIYIDYSLNPYTQLNLLLDKSNTSYTIENIIIEPINTTHGQGFVANGFKIYDEQGKTLEDEDIQNKNIFVPKISKDKTDTFMYVLRVTADTCGGDFRIKINEKSSS